jgi:hypothetical protein
MTKRLIGPPPGWASDGYGVQWSSTGFRAWVIRDRDTTWLDWHTDVTTALLQAEEVYARASM